MKNVIPVMLVTFNTNSKRSICSSVAALGYFDFLSRPNYRVALNKSEERIEFRFYITEALS